MIRMGDKMKDTQLEEKFEGNTSLEKTLKEILFWPILNAEEQIRHPPKDRGLFYGSSTAVTGSLAQIGWLGMILPAMIVGTITLAVATSPYLVSLYFWNRKKIRRLERISPEIVNEFLENRSREIVRLRTGDYIGREILPITDREINRYIKQY